MPTAINSFGEFVDVSEPRMLKLKPVNMEKLRAEAKALYDGRLKNAKYGIGECEWCHKQFPKNVRRNQRFCCRRCSSSALNAKRDAQRKAKNAERDARIIEMRERGCKFSDIAEAVGLSSAYVRTIYSRLRKEA